MAMRLGTMVGMRTGMRTGAVLRLAMALAGAMALPAAALPEGTTTADIALWSGGPNDNRSVTGHSVVIVPSQAGAGHIGANGAQARVQFVGPGGGTWPGLGLLLLGATVLGLRRRGTQRPRVRQPPVRASVVAPVFAPVFALVGLMAMADAHALVTPSLQVPATATGACGLSTPGATGQAQQGANSLCNGVTVTGQAYGEPYTFQGNASGLTTLGNLTILASARADGSMNFLGDGLVAQGMSASASGFMAFDLVQTGPAPFVADVPVHIQVLASAAVSGNAGAALLVRLDNAPLLNRSFSGLSQPQQADIDLHWSPLIALSSGTHSITKAASCVIVVDSLQSPTANCEARVDPILSLDQAAFDATWGAESFPLADYYAIRVSANLAPVPEPAAWALLLAGLLLLGSGRRRGAGR